MTSEEVGDYVGKNFVASYQKVGTFRIVNGQKQGGNVASYFCLPDGTVLHAVAGPLDAKTLALIKIGICIGAGLESALRSHVRRAMQHGATPAEVEQAILLGMNTVGFPRTVAAWSWAQEQFKRGV